MDGLEVGEIKYPHTEEMFIRMNESGVTVNLPLASANHSNTNADAPSYSSTLRIGFENVCILRGIRLGQLHRR
jgi:hypothetical protein